MSAMLRALGVAGASVSSLVVLTACGPGGLAGDDESGPTSTPQQSGLATVDPCEILKPDVAKEFGFDPMGEPNDIVKSSPGCDYESEDFGMTIVTVRDKSIDEFAQQDNWAQFDRVEVSDRSGATTIDASATQARICSTMFDAADGVVSVDLSESRDKGLDECAESKKIAEAIEPNTPE